MALAGETATSRLPGVLAEGFGPRPLYALWQVVAFSREARISESNPA